MDEAKINLLCTNILRAANSIECRGEQNAAQILGICQAARQIAVELQKNESEVEH